MSEMFESGWKLVTESGAEYILPTSPKGGEGEVDSTKPMLKSDEVEVGSNRPVSSSSEPSSSSYIYTMSIPNTHAVDIKLSNGEVMTLSSLEGITLTVRPII